MTVGLRAAPRQMNAPQSLPKCVVSAETWAPSKESWGQLRDLEHFIGRRVRLKFWDKIMHLLEDEGPYPTLSDCRGIVLLRQEGFLQAYLILSRIEELPNSSGYPPAKFLDSKKYARSYVGSNCRAAGN